jgi:hypothetical protein
MAFRLCKRDGEKHGFSNRHPYKNSVLYEEHSSSGATFTLRSQRALQAAEKFASLKGTAFRPYITVV